METETYCMKRSLDEHASRFDSKAPEYDSSKSDEYKATVSLVVDHASPTDSDTVLDLGTGTGAIALATAESAQRVVGRDISDGMLEQAREKAADRGLDTVEFDKGRFREPNAPESVDIVTSNFALHHLSDAEKREAITLIGELEPRRFVLGDVMFFDEPNPEEPFYDPSVDDPATVGNLIDAVTDAGFAVTDVEKVHGQVGVLVGERLEE